MSAIKWFHCLYKIQYQTCIKAAEGWGYDLNCGFFEANQPGIVEEWQQFYSSSFNKYFSHTSPLHLFSKNHKNGVILLQLQFAFVYAVLVYLIQG
jgi:hypothetical protein